MNKICLLNNLKSKFHRLMFCYQQQVQRQQNFTSLTQQNITENSIENSSPTEKIPDKDITNKQSKKTNQKLLKVAIIGLPNAGKSTFINNVINHRVCPTSNKVHTTRDFRKAIYTKDNAQIILFDTPGLVTESEIKRYNLEKQFTSTVRHSIQHSNLIGVMQDVSNRFTRHQLHPIILNTLKSYPNIPSFLILNKIDAIKSKRILLDLVKQLTNDTLIKSKQNKKVAEKLANNMNKMSNKKENEIESVNGWSHFSEIFMISALSGNGLDEVMSYMLKNAIDNPWEYKSNEFTDRSPEELIVTSVHARLLDYLPQEIPYKLKCEMEYFKIEKGKIFASVEITCPSPRIEKLVCGEANGKLRQITERITSDLVETFQKPITLTISTRNKNDLR